MISKKNLAFRFLISWFGCLLESAPTIPTILAYENFVGILAQNTKKRVLEEE